MAGFIGKFVLGKIFKESVENKFGLEDTYFEQVPATRLDGTPNGKFKKVRKALPPGLTQHDAEILTKVKRRAYRLDMSFGSFLGLKFGWGSIIGIVPVAGDFADALLGLTVVRAAKQIEGGLPSSLKMQMYFWVLVDLVVGFIPFLGDLLDAAVLANTRNARLLEDYLRTEGKKNLRASGLAVPEVDPSDPHEFDRFQSESPNHAGTAHHASREERLPAGHSNAGHQPQSSGVTAAPPQPPRPAQAKVRDDRRASSGGGFFGSGRKKSRPADVEMGAGDHGSSGKQSRRG